MDISDSTLAPRTLLFLFTCGTVVGCAATDQPPEQPDETPSVDTSAATPVATPEPITQDTTPPPLDPAAFREQVRLELADLTNGTTPDMWMESHPNDEMRRFEYDPILAWGGWCVTTDHNRTAGRNQHRLPVRCFGSAIAGADARRQHGLRL